MEPETIVRNIGSAVALFLDRYSPESADRFRDHLQDWNTVWPRIKDWLIRSEDSLKQGTAATVRSFVRNIPDHESFRIVLDVSLDYHNEFWDRIHDNLCVARERIVEP